MYLQSREEEYPIYGIIESHEFADMFERLVGDPRVRDQIKFAFESELPLDPDKFERIENTAVRRAIINCCPPLRLFFTVSERTITLLQIHPVAND